MGYVMPVTGTHIWYYFICKREVWLIIHNIAADQEDENLEIGRFLSENTYKRNKKETLIGNIVVDRIRREGEQIVIGEVKKSSKYKTSAKYQLLYYLDKLREMGINAKGELLFPTEKKKELIEWTEEESIKLSKVIEDIRKIARLPKPPKPEKISFCRNCAYREFCWAEE
ncbi:CRISPR-associated protein Cas4 [Calidifontibacillus erzurumensis]|uniref:CRISPR-associated exonuclease Cas4 n=1 Tax=Calidifontibacillus erzurumensis TaxID=2741433 RepID=A0A8J8KFK9_9BACI|nr:CRISPR-associated protein Cas4 [Calidifontibacillus erzurumensis]NSL53035.1 CRISPR-associated protein Cas4 [Calidifontibacillus erzurumensis]